MLEPEELRRARARPIGAGNISAPASWTWVADTVPPSVTLTQTPPNPSTSGTSTFKWTGNDGPNGSGVAFYLCRLDSGNYLRCSSPDTVTVANGGHTFSVIAVDWAGNVSAQPSWFWLSFSTQRTVGQALWATPSDCKLLTPGGIWNG